MARNKFNIDEELDVPFNWQQFKRALVYIKHYRKNIAMMFFFSCISILLGLLAPKIQQADILMDILGSDHCPVTLELSV